MDDVRVSRRDDGVVPVEAGIAVRKVAPEVRSSGFLAREESRGAHLRTDFPECETRLNGYHSIVTAGDTEVVHEAWG